MTFHTFLGNLGGQMGLWMGLCVVTLVKLIILVVPGCASLCHFAMLRKHLALSIFSSETTTISGTVLSLSATQGFLVPLYLWLPNFLMLGVQLFDDYWWT